ncbi:hypothetical protein VCHA53O466_140160 [Vibrio chagasii]|nr:hypothetical protein VCHA53O466_140160 [Vibrio chagasii]
MSSYKVPVGFSPYEEPHLIAVADKYREVQWPRFSKIADLYICLTGFQYDYVTDADIEFCLQHPLLDVIDINLDWEADDFLAESEAISEDLKHALRIARLVKDIKAGDFVMNAVEFDTYVSDRCKSCISNGHHRIRALQYLGFTGFPATMSGDEDFIDDIGALYLKREPVV